VPGAGDAVKRSLRSVKSGVTHIDELLDMIRRLYKGDPEKALREVLDISKLRGYLNKILDNPSLTRQLSPGVRKSIDDIQANLNRQFDAFKREVDGWLARGRKTSAAPGPAGRAKPGTPPAKPGTQARAGSQNRGAHSNSASPNTPNAASQRTARFKTLSNKVLGVMGEHMADYHCQDVKGWGRPMRHDQNGINAAKLNDGGHLIPLWPPIPRGRGIDAVWRSQGGSKRYAIIEAKASYNPAKGLASLLGEAGDKTERGDGTSANDPGRGGGAGGRGRGGSRGVTRQTNGKITQMSHGWISKRLQSIVLTSASAKVEMLRDKQRAYSRSVLFFSIPHAVAHAEALILLTSSRPLESAFHAAHQATREWGDNQIENVVSERAAIPKAARGRR
jgi:hypothetical protein